MSYAKNPHRVWAFVRLRLRVEQMSYTIHSSLTGGAQEGGSCGRRFALRRGRNGSGSIRC